jgi:hypothetical protein
MMLRTLSLVTVSTLAACSSQLYPPSDAKQSPGLDETASGADHADPARPVIAKLVFRDVDLAILSGKGGPRFTVADKLGAPLATELEDDELRARYPEIYEAYRFSFVQRGRPYLDATLSPRHEARSSR